MGRGLANRTIKIQIAASAISQWRKHWQWPRSAIKCHKSPSFYFLYGNPTYRWSSGNFQTHTGFASVIISSGCVALSAFITLAESKLNRDRKVKSCIYCSFTLSLLPSPHTGSFAASALHASSAPYKLWKPPPQKSEALRKAIGFGYPKRAPGAFLILLLPPVYIPPHFSFSMGKR